VSTPTAVAPPTDPVVDIEVTRRPVGWLGAAVSGISILSLDETILVRLSAPLASLCDKIKGNRLKAKTQQ